MRNELNIKEKMQKNDVPVSTKPLIGLRSDEINKIAREYIEQPHADYDPVSGKPRRKQRRRRPPLTLGVRAYLSDEEGEGYWDFLLLRDGLTVSITDAVYKTSAVVTLEPEAIFKVRLMLSGAIYADDGEIIAQAGDVWIHSLSGRRPYSYHIKASDEEFKMIVVHGAARALDVLELDPDTIGAPFDEIVRSGVFKDSMRLIKADVSLRQLALDIFNSRDRLTASLRAHYLRAKVEELLCLAIDRTRPLQTLKIGRNRLLARDIARLHEARSILTANLADTPTVSALSRMLALNETKLKAGFRKLFGETIQEYVTRAKLETALALIETSDLSISEIGYRLGYRYPANFTQAFKARYGVTPRAAREARNDSLADEPAPQAQ